jgi:methylmalonyl-CoA/ethylmalonyl-CoA epimerase
MSGLSGHLRQVSQPAADLDRAIAFYRDVLGLRLIARYGDLSFFDLDGTRLLLERSDTNQGSAILYLAVSDLDNAWHELTERGVNFVGPPHTIFTDGDGTFGTAGEDERMAFFHDTEGNLLALSSREPMRA